MTFHKVTYIPGEANVLADALSRLTRHLRVEGRELENIKPRILGLSTCQARRARQMMHTDPLVSNLAKIGSLCPEYLRMLSLVEDRTPPGPPRPRLYDPEHKRKDLLAPDACSDSSGIYQLRGMLVTQDLEDPPI